MTMKILLLDIETAPNRVYAWGLWDQNIYIDQIEEPGYTMCWAAKWLGDKEVIFSSRQETTMEKMVKKIWDLIDEADAVIHYNGTKFDMPTLNKEFITYGLSKPAPYKQIDLLRTARSQFRFPSNKLDYVTQYLGLEGKLEHKGMSLWRDCMAGKDAAWKIMKKYNIQDVKILEDLYRRLLPWIPNHPNVNLYDESTTPRCPKCGGKHLQKRGFAYTPTMVYQRYQCQTCKSWSRERTNSMDKEKKRSLLVETK